MNQNLAILGAGNIGTAIAKGLVQAERLPKENLYLTRRKSDLLDDFDHEGFNVGHDNLYAISQADTMIIAVEPQQIDDLLNEIRDHLVEGTHTVISVVSGVSIEQIRAKIRKNVTIIRAMPNTAIAIRESMTCLAAEKGNENALEYAKTLFDAVGTTLLIDEEQMIAATALGACGIAFFLRAIRAASQGGIEIGFHAEDAIHIAAQTAKGAASLLMTKSRHPEDEIDKVTTPRGCTIAGLNQMEHAGFSSALIRGITASAEKANNLYNAKKCSGS